MNIPTYPFSDPDPIPILWKNPKIFPYYKYNGYSKKSVNKKWKVVTLENKYIKVIIIPDLGGKVWGAIDKTTGEEFIYQNDAIKFRNISMRGPWTSGGIEFNFGVVGHHPSTVAHVDYQLQKYAGSKSCIVGTTDLPSNTQWQVEIRLSEGQSFFETRTAWYNASEQEQAYYNWMTAAAVASEDLEFFIPGNISLNHNGTMCSWSIDKQGRRLNRYRENNFGGNKSYHITGIYKDFYCGYYHDKQVGFGHWSAEEQMPGKKLWLWALSREGAIWEDLLTDNHGQYVEYQMGRLLTQFTPSNAPSVITQVGFEPFVRDYWEEIWFPFKDIGGVKKVNRYAAINIERNKNNILLKVNALQQINDTISVFVNDKKVFQKAIKMEPATVGNIKVNNISATENYTLKIGHLMSYNSDHSQLLLKRPYRVSQEEFDRQNTAYYRGYEALKGREYAKAKAYLLKAFAKDSVHKETLIKLADIYIRADESKKALNYINRVLKINTYHPEANYLGGLAYRDQADYYNALDSFGWAARSIGYRSAAYTEMAQIYLQMGLTEKASEYAKNALQFNTQNISALKTLAVASRLNKNKAVFDKTIHQIQSLAPLDPFTKVEKALNTNQLLNPILEKIRSEFPFETCLQVAIYYHRIGQNKDAMSILRASPNHVKIKLWKAYITCDIALLDKIAGQDPSFVFPYRKETLKVLEWVVNHHKNWKFKYYLAQNYIAINHLNKGLELLNKLEDKPDYDMFYSFRARMNTDRAEKDYSKALKIAPQSWKHWYDLANHYMGQNLYEQAYNFLAEAVKTFPENQQIRFSYAQAAIAMADYKTAVDASNVNILPSEGFKKARKVFEEAHLLYAQELIKKGEIDEALENLKVSKTWPETLGAGKPYQPDERWADYLIAVCYRKQGNKNQSIQYLNKVIDRTPKVSSNTEPDIKYALRLIALENKKAKNQLQKELSILESKVSKKAKQTIEVYHQLAKPDSQNSYSLLIRDSYSSK
ncbi:TPR-domain containing protein [Elysia marginata]|uniref:Cell division cycle protein 27 homolog n=1 Tax=Elysia marginata TaxID=1093978 RepID=A0AAV4G5E6_9GAST|nr:TPR-domain containing protein [Elysia marginata]